jgi:DNA end-binding protein Ku
MPSIVWKGQLTFGLGSIPVKLYRAARRERVRMHYVHQPEVGEGPPDEPDVSPAEVPGRSAAPAPQRIAAFPPRAQAPSAPALEPPSPEPSAPITRVHQALVTPDERPISRADVHLGYEVEPDRYVVIDPEELKDIRRKTSTTMEIVRSVKLAEIDPMFFENSYYVVPDRGGEKPYAILFRALQETGHVALARVGMYGREHVVIVRPGRHGMLAHTMFYVDEIRSESEFRTDVAAVGAKELELAKTFLEALEAPFAPEEFRDEYRAALEAMIAQKAAKAGAAPAGKSAPATKPVVDILEALKKSIAMTRKPAGSETQTAGKTPGRVGRRGCDAHSHGLSGLAIVPDSGRSRAINRL